MLGSPYGPQLLQRHPSRFAVLRHAPCPAIERAHPAQRLAGVHIQFARSNPAWQTRHPAHRGRSPARRIRAAAPRPRRGTVVPALRAFITFAHHQRLAAAQDDRVRKFAAVRSRHDVVHAPSLRAARKRPRTAGRQGGPGGEGIPARVQRPDEEGGAPNVGTRYAATASAASCDGSAASAPAMASSRCCGE